MRVSACLRRLSAAPRPPICAVRFVTDAPLFWTRSGCGRVPPLRRVAVTVTGVPTKRCGDGVKPARCHVFLYFYPLMVCAFFCDRPEGNGQSVEVAAAVCWHRWGITRRLVTPDPVPRGHGASISLERGY